LLNMRFLEKQGDKYKPLPLNWYKKYEELLQILHN